MYTATKDLTLPTTVTGSWPRPSWYATGLWGRSFSSGMNDLQFREQYTDAMSALISDQERAGLDILTNGDYHHDADLGGRAWVQYGLERLGGTTDPSAGHEVALEDFAYPPARALWPMRVAR